MGLFYNTVKQKNKKKVLQMFITSFFNKTNSINISNQEQPKQQEKGWFGRAIQAITPPACSLFCTGQALMQTPSVVNFTANKVVETTSFGLIKGGGIASKAVAPFVAPGVYKTMVGTVAPIAGTAGLALGIGLVALGNKLTKDNSLNTIEPKDQNRYTSKSVEDDFELIEDEKEFTFTREPLSGQSKAIEGTQQQEFKINKGFHTPVNEIFKHRNN